MLPIFFNVPWGLFLFQNDSDHIMCHIIGPYNVYLCERERYSSLFLAYITWTIDCGVKVWIAEVWANTLIHYPFNGSSAHWESHPSPRPAAPIFHLPNVYLGPLVRLLQPKHTAMIDGQEIFKIFKQRLDHRGIFKQGDSASSLSTETHGWPG